MMTGKRFIISGERWRMKEGLDEGHGCAYRYNSIMNHLCKKHGFVHRAMTNRDVYPHVRYLNVEPLPLDTELIYVWWDIHSNDFENLMPIFNTTPKAKIIWLVGGDRRSWHWGEKAMAGTKVYRPGMKKFLKRVSVILDSQIYSWRSKPRSTTFAICYPQFAYKHVFYPNNFCPDEHYLSLRYRKNPIKKCLLHGRPGGRYELRNHVIKRLAENPDLNEFFDAIKHPNLKKMTEGDISEIADIRRHPKEKEYDIEIYTAYLKLNFLEKGKDEFGKIVGKDYAKALNRYYCGLGVNGGRKINAVLLKHMEIPAAGALLFSERFYDLDLAGFIPGEHYVEVKAEYLTELSHEYVQSDVVLKALEAIRNPEKYNNIRKSGMKFVREKHSEGARFKFLDEIIEKLLNGETIFRNYPKIKELGEK